MAHETPHHQLFHEVFRNPREAAGLIRPRLPKDVDQQFFWLSFRSADPKSLDENLLESETDLLFSVKYIEDGEPSQGYVLLLFQWGAPDSSMPFRVLKYCCRIWEAALRNKPAEKLPVVLPVVYYQGDRELPHTTEMSELLPETSRSRPWTPRFEYVLLDDSKLEPEDIGRI